MGAVLGLILGAVNVLVVALAYKLSGEDGAFLIVMFGIAPGLCTGAALGFVAEMTKAVHPIVRWFMLAVPAVGAVAILGRLFGMNALIVYASIPTLVGASILERKTRKKPVPPPIPLARAS